MLAKHLNNTNFERDKVMKKNELQDVLTKMRVPSMLYNLDGKGRKDERFCLEFADNEWRVYFCEKGVKTTNEKFSSEEEACQFIYEQLC